MTEGDGEKDRPGGYASPPCFMHELESGGKSGLADEVAWKDVARWRKAERTRLIEARLAIPADDRAAMAARIAAGLDAAIGSLAGRTVSLYWPFRGEPDLRLWIGAAISRGGRVALPVVVEKAQPLVFRAYAPGDPLEKGVWNIPVPAGGETVLPDIVVAPLVGVDPDKYRLGYGGGFFDRTLASLPRKPLAIGVGYEMQRIPTIYPQEHDVPMDLIVTEAS